MLPRLLQSNISYLIVYSFIRFNVSDQYLNKHKKKDCLNAFTFKQSSMLKKAATYSPTLRCSTIGALGLNFSVRDGKRWNPKAIATWYLFYIMYLLLTYTTLWLWHQWQEKITQLWYTKLKEHASRHDKADGQLVLLGFDVTIFTPAAYQRRSLQRPYEI